jgi:hypothetical protein
MNPLLLAGIVAGLALAGAATLGRAWRRARATADTLSRIAPVLLEHDQFFALVDLAGPGSHYLERHGPMLHVCEILQRAETGRLDVSGLAGRPVASARWFTHADMLSAIASALEHWHSGARPAGGRFSFVFDREIGEGFRKHGGAAIRTNVAIVIVRDGAVITAYPSLADA